MDMNTLNPNSEMTDLAVTNISAEKKIKSNEAAVEPFNKNDQKDNTVDNQISREEANEIVKSLYEYIDVLQTKLKFSISENSNEIIITVTNQETDEIIRQIPPKSLLALREKMAELTGLLFDKTV